jgi:hypothetical protein
MIATRAVKVALVAAVALFASLSRGATFRSEWLLVIREVSDG